MRCPFQQTLNRVAIILFLLLVIIFGVFVYVFHDQQLSLNISDWGAFGSYVGGTVGIISVVLLYFTYNNQVKANRKSQFETILFQMIGSFKERFTARKEDWDKAYEHIEKYYIASGLTNAEIITKKNVIKAVEYSYNNSASDSNLNGQMDIFCDIISYIGREESLDEKDKKAYYTFLALQMTNEMLIIIMLGLVARNDYQEIEFLKKGDFFKNVDMGDNIVLDRIRQLYFSIVANEIYKNQLDDNLDNLRHNAEKFPETFMDYYSNFIASEMG